MIRLHDTMAREKREFVPQDEKRVTLYVCGPTVYGRAHIGNARPAVVFDTLVRLLRHTYGANAVVYARNVTDVDDKIMAAAAEEGVDVSVITERFEKHYLDDMGALGVLPPDIAPHATQEIPAMVTMIEQLVRSDNAYVADGHVLFSVPSDLDYGALSRRDREQMIAGARVEVAPYKRDPADFVLWKPSTDDQVGWDSPWGRGRPGWHIECSAMIAAHLGETIDIHGGGLDLIFPHHENEIAQSRCTHSKPLANYWVHNGFLDMGAEKMSKSLGNVVTPEVLLQKHKGETLRLALLSAHYRSPLPWTDTLIAQSKAILDRWYRALDKFQKSHPNAVQDDRATIDLFLDASGLGDDLNTPGAIADLNNVVATVLGMDDLQKLSSDDANTIGSLLKGGANMLGLLTLSPDQWFRGEGGSDDIDAKVEARNAAKAARDFATADRLRDELKAEGILLEDGPGGTTWRRA